MGRKAKLYNKDSPFLDNLDKADLSPMSKRLYMERWRVLMNTHKKDVFHILTKPNAYVEWIMKTYDSPQTQKSYISSVLAMFRHNVGLKEQESKAYAAWFAAFSEVHAQVEARYRKNEPTDKQAAGYVPFDDIIKKRDSLVKGSDERILLAFYTYIPPLRCDLNKVRILNPLEKPKEDDKNYIILDKSKKVATLVLTEFKTARHRDPYQKELPADLVHELLESLHVHPRDYLFVDRDGKPYYLSNSFTRWANRVLLRLFQKGLTISLIRHAFINTLDFNKLTIEEKDNIAKDMAHTIGMQDRYRLFFDKKVTGVSGGSSSGGSDQE